MTARTNRAAAAMGTALLAGLLTLTGVTGGVASASAACSVHGNSGMLTVAGAIAKTNRPAFSEAADRLHGYRGNRFEHAFVFTMDGLAALPQQSVSSYLTYDQKVSRFDGPSLHDVLKAVGVTSFKTVTLQAIDGYEVRLTPEQAATEGQILALCRDGVPLPLGGLGPISTAVPLAPGQTTAPESVTNHQVWGLLLIGVE